MVWKNCGDARIEDALLAARRLVASDLYSLDECMSVGADCKTFDDEGKSARRPYVRCLGKIDRALAVVDQRKR